MVYRNREMVKDARVFTFNMYFSILIYGWISFIGRKKRSQGGIVDSGLSNQNMGRVMFWQRMREGILEVCVWLCSACDSFCTFT